VLPCFVTGIKVVDDVERVLRVLFEFGSVFISISSVVAALLWLGVSEKGSLILDVVGLLVELDVLK
jgi:hypothetical protein